jgi:hypothetical protein
MFIPGFILQTLQHPDFASYLLKEIGRVRRREDEPFEIVKRVCVVFNFLTI